MMMSTPISMKHHGRRDNIQMKRQAIDSPLLKSLAILIVIIQEVVGGVAEVANQNFLIGIKISENESRKQAFLNWFIDNGGIFHPIQVRDGDDGVLSAAVNVSIEQFPSFGGWGLALPIVLPPAQEVASMDDDVGSEECQPDDSPNQCTVNAAGYASPTTTTTTTTTAIIKRLDPLFTVPSSLIISVDSVMDIYTIESSPFYLSSFYPNVNKILLRSYTNPYHHHGVGLSRGSQNTMGLVEQDVIIAMHLMVEDCHHQLYNTHQFTNNMEEDSHWGEYLDVLPQYIIPRLDTFGDEEYEALQDANLEFAGRNSKRSLERLFLIHQEEEDDGAAMNKSNEISLQSVIRDMIYRKLDFVTKASIPESSSATATTNTVLDTCTSFETFHRFIGIVASRAMVLNGRKFLTPLADMINYSPYVDPDRSDENRDLIKAPFTLFHTLLENNSITVRSDRDVFLPSSFDKAEVANEEGEATIQLFEDYGPVDSSLFLEAHGFVPYENPNNCAIILGTHFLRRYAAAGRLDENVALVLRALKLLHLIHPDETKLEALNDVCVKANLEIVDDGEVAGRKPASDALAITSLILSDSGYPDWIQIEKDYGQSFTSLRDKCTAAIHSKDAQRVVIRCARYPGSSSIVKQALRTAAMRVISGLEGKGDTVADLSKQLQLAESQGRDQLALALRFRLEERSMLNRIVATEDKLSVPQLKSDHNNIVHAENHAESSDTQKKLLAFESFVETLELPVNEIEPRLVGNGLRLGVFATRDLDFGESYVSFPLTSVIDVDTALASVAKSSDLSALLLKYSKHQGSLLNGGFDVLLLYLLHERFVLKERSRWWAYLDLLPSIDDMRESHPLFFDHEEIDTYLSGSDVRQFILRYHRLSWERHNALSSDLTVNLVLGCDTIMDRNKVYWAIAIIDSRSIWWDGKRHLVPLLDLVNADIIGIAHETRIESTIEDKVAVTRASRPVKKGEQLFENYAQPNYLLFTYHGFVLQENPNDCALLDGVYIHVGDPEAENAHRFQAKAPTFCIIDKDSIDNLAQYIRSKYVVSLESEVRSYLIQVLEERIDRLKDGMNTISHVKNEFPRLSFMNQIVKNDLIYFQYALDNFVLK